MIIPAPQSITETGGSYRIGPGTVIGAEGDAEPAARYLAGFWHRPVAARGQGAVLDLRGDADLGDEGYRLDIGDAGVRLRAHAPAGLFRGVQTLRQLPDPLPGLRIIDRPRYAWRGVMLDVARRFFPPDEVRRLIDLAALYKINVLHLHLTDDQGWRIAIDGWPRLTAHGDHYTAAEYAEIVRYAAERHITVVPEIDGPGHVHAALVAYPELSCDGAAREPYTGRRVGFSSLCVRKDLTYRFLDEVLGEVARLTPGPYLHIGGDEAKTTEPADYAYHLGRVRDIVRRHGRTLVGWQEAAGVPEIVQYWHPGRHEDAVREAVRQGAKVVMSPGDHAYLDMKYDRDSPLGQDWAGTVGVRESYEWDPDRYLDGADVIGVEAALWTETVRSVRDAEYLLFPRLPGIAEAGWSPGGRQWAEYRGRLAAQARLWDTMGVGYHRSPEVPWT